MQQCVKNLKERDNFEIVPPSLTSSIPPTPPTLRFSYVPSELSHKEPLETTQDVYPTKTSLEGPRSKRSLLTWVKSKNLWGREHLIDAAMKGDIVRVQEILSKNNNTTLDQETKNKALIEASTNDGLIEDQVNIVELLIDKGAMIDVQGRKSLPLIGTIWQKKNQRRTPLIWAICYGQMRIVETLLYRVAQIETSDDELGLTPLMWASCCGHEAITALLITRANLEAGDTRGMTPLMLAVVEQDETVVKLLLVKGANIGYKDENGMPALCLAAKEGYCNVVQTLLDGGAALEAKDDAEGRTALTWAAAFLRYDVIDLLISKGADRAAIDKNGNTVEDWLR